MKNNLSGKKYTSIGGQALIEGVMMRGEKVTAMSVRLPSGEIDTENWLNSSVKQKYPVLKLPVIRGVVNYIEMLAQGYQTLSKSAEKAGMEEDEEPGKFEQTVNRIFGGKLYSALTAVSAVLGVVLAIGLFTVLPAYAVKGLSLLVNLGGAKVVVETLIRLFLFLLYLFLVSRMKDIRRVFEYHGAEHKTIACFEAGEELTPENAAKYSRFHIRCGTSFLLLALIVSMLVFFFVTWNNIAVRVLLKLLLLPVVVGVTYEIFKLSARLNNWFTVVVSAPGLWLQRLTTQEPDASQLEVAISAMKRVLEQEGSAPAPALPSEAAENQ